MTNKTNAILKIIAGCVAAVLLLGILVVLIQINASLKAQDDTQSDNAVATRATDDDVDIVNAYDNEAANGDTDESAVTTAAEVSETPEATTTAATEAEPETTTTEATTTQAATTTTQATTTTAAATTTAPATSSATSSSNSNYSSATGDFTMDTTGITDIEIDWYSGSVTVIPYSGTTIQVSETSSSTISSSNVLYYTVNKYGELKINFNSSNRFSNAGISKDLTVYIPSSMYLDELSIEATSADIVISDAQGTLSVRDLSVETTSGNSTIKGITATEMSADTTSGTISISSCTISTELDIEVTSGSATVALPSGTGYTLEYETTTGTVSASGTTLKGEGRTTVGTGTLKIDVETTSGNVTITN
ncbi:MAG: DUF4097 domain-containing protein [Oscillospiraceae bacterium]|nr:DUF4097 domain-containing protein [Oscillospiraceae bacterium]